MQNSPIISIITVTYNAEAVIGKTLDSLKHQTFQDFEHIVVDGASSDRTLEIIRNSDTNPVVISEADQGLYDAMNKGLRLAKGKYILFLNAGDSFHTEGTLESYAREAFQDADIIYGDTVIANMEGKVTGKRHLSVPDILTKKSFANGMLVCHQAFMVKRELVPLYDLNYRFSADYDWCVKCIANSQPEKNVNLREVTVRYLSDGLTDKNKFRSLRERFQIMSKHYGLIPTIVRHIGFVFRAFKRGKI